MSKPREIIIRQSQPANDKAQKSLMIILTLTLIGSMLAVSFADWWGGKGNAASHIFLLVLIASILGFVVLIGRELVNFRFNKLHGYLQVFCERAGLLKQDTDDKHSTITAKFHVSHGEGRDVIEYFPRASKLVSYDELPNLMIEVFEEMSHKPWILVSAQPSRTSLKMTFKHIEDRRLKVGGADDYAPD